MDICFLPQYVTLHQGNKSVLSVKQNILISLVCKVHIEGLMRDTEAPGWWGDRMERILTLMLL